MRPIWLVSAVAALATSASAAPPLPGGTAQSREQCFWASRITGFSDAGPDKALLNIGARETWEITLSPGCPDVNWAMSIGIRSRGTERICSGSDAELLVPYASGSGYRRCLVRNVRQLSPEEHAAARSDIDKKKP